MLQDKSANSSFLAGTNIGHHRRKELIHFAKLHHLKIKDIILFHTAFIHRSATNESSNKTNNERLEFLGDAVLGSVVASLLYTTLGDKNEGEMAKIKSFLVSEDNLSALALQLNIDRLLVLSKGEENSGGRQKKAILADAFEAMVAAIYLDAGHGAVYEFLSTFMKDEIFRVLENRHKRDYKTLLQEFCQGQFREYPQYRLVNKTGPQHSRIFWMEVSVNKKTYGPFTGRSKKSAEQLAAKAAWDALNQEL